MSRILRGSEYQAQPLQLRDLDALPDETEEGIFEAAAMPQQERTFPSDTTSFRGEGGPTEESKSETESGGEKSLLAVDVEAERQEAYEIGLAHGREEAHNELHSATQFLLDAAKKFDGLRTTLYERQKDDLISLALVIAKQVIGQELQTNEEVIVGVVENALKSALETDSHHIRVHPDDLAVVQEHRPLFLANVHGLKEISVEADKNVSRGGCVIESDMGEVDASVETRLAGIEAQLQGAVRQ